MLLKLYIIFFSILATLNVEIQNYKVVDFIKRYNIHKKISLHLILYKKNYAKTLYYFFKHLNNLKQKNSNLKKFVDLIKNNYR